MNSAAIFHMVTEIVTYIFYRIRLHRQLCRLVFAILNANYPDASERLKSLDQYYRYVLIGHTIPEKLIPVNGPQGVQIVAGK